MKAKPFKLVPGTGYVPCEINEATYLMLNLPGPTGTLMLPVILNGSREGTNCWSWNGETEFPTLKPSVLTRKNRFTKKGEEDYNKWMDQDCPELPHGTWFESENIICHSWINVGCAVFLDDCTHELKNQSVELLDVEQ